MDGLVDLPFPFARTREPTATDSAPPVPDTRATPICTDARQEIGSRLALYIVLREDKFLTRGAEVNGLIWS